MAVAFGESQTKRLPDKPRKTIGFMSYEKPSEEENGGVYTQADVLSPC
jgi:hypothetical protein